MGEVEHLSMYDVGDARKPQNYDSKIVIHTQTA